MPNQTPDDRFDEKFYNVGDGVGGRWLNGTPDEIKSFLHSEIDLAIEKSQAEYLVEANEMIEQARIDALEQAAKDVNDMHAPIFLNQDGETVDWMQKEAYLSGCREAADIIRKLKNK